MFKKCWILYLMSVVNILISSSSGFAQIIPDSTLGTENSVVENNENRDTINGGAIRDANLFHSFQDFNVGAGREAYFTNPNGIENIFSRVTGNNISDIQGVLGVLGNSNLFLINPNGILFGKNARLDVNGSFFATTADSVLFGSGFEFSATNPNQPPLLTVDIPIGLRFRDNPGDITLKGRLLDSRVIDTDKALRVDSEATIGLLGGNLVFEDATIKTAGGNIELGSVAGGKVDLVEVANIFTFDYSQIASFKDISLSGNSVIDSSGNGGGDINIETENLIISGLGELGRAAINASTSGQGNAGNINIKTENLIISDRAAINASTSGQGNAGNININATDNVSLNGSPDTPTLIVTNATSDAIVNGGNININTSLLTLTNRASLRATSKQGNAGNITINASDIVSFDGQGNNNGLFTNVSSSSIGNAGNIEINTRSLTLENKAGLFARHFGQGKGGDVTINAINDVYLSNNSNISVIGAEGGTISIVAKNLSLISDSTLVTGIAKDLGFTNAQSGDITIDVTEQIYLDKKSFISNNIERDSEGNSGDINIVTSNLTLSNNSSIVSDNFGKGKGGNIIINADFISLNNSSNRISTDLEKTGLGTVGNIDINVNSLFFTGVLSSVTSNNFGEGEGGDIIINAKDFIALDGSENSISTDLKFLASGLTLFFWMEEIGMD